MLPDGGRWSGGPHDRCPVDVRDLRAAIELKFAWRQKVGGMVQVVLDGRTDEIRILGPCVPDEHRAILDQVREWHARGIGEPGTEPPPPNGDQDEANNPPPDHEKTLPKFKRLSREASDLRSGKIGHDDDYLVDRSVREYVDLHDRPSDLDSFAQLLSHIEQVARSDEQAYEKERRRLDVDERWLDRWTYGGTALALALILTGAYLIFFTDGNLTIGVLGKVVGLIPGAGAVFLRLKNRTLEIGART